MREIRTTTIGTRTHARDSWNGSGGNLSATVHYSVNYNNAVWRGDLQLAYFGDGDGYAYGPWHSLDVVAHEFTHGVTQTEANLTYQNESGALNESMSDVFGAMTERFVTGGNPATNTWQLGEDVALGTRVCSSGVTNANDAIRYMNRPTCDGSSSDYYPERYTGPADNGGVHWNSGISNLGFYLLSQGGTHPRGKTTINVPGIGYAKAELIFYRTLRDNLLSNDGFLPAGNKTEAFTKTQYGPLSSELKSTCAAWEAVGVPDNRLNCPDPNANLLPPATMPPVGDICYGNQDVSWSAVSGATFYQLRISPNSSDYTIAGVYYSGSSTQTTVSMGTNPNTPWSYARVSACNGNGCSALSSAVRTVRATSTCN